jgi:hypothetical protein
MTREELFESWAPAGGLWSDWTKPVLFAHWPRPLPPDPEPPAFDLSWLPPPGERVALVIDLPGASGVHFGLTAAAAGYRPVPLFNAVPPPEEAAGMSVVVVEPILAALVRGADRLRGLALPAHAPPAFLLDTDRQTARRDLSPGAFDNRSVVFATDFPSAARLAEHGTRRAILVRDDVATLDDDLKSALHEWQRDGLALAGKSLGQPGAPGPLVLARRGWWAGFWSWITGPVRYRRNAAGEFGAFIPHPSGG